MGRREAYRLSGKLFKFWVYALLELLFAVLMFLTIYLYFTDSPSLELVFAAVVVSVIHHFSMVLMKPLKLLKAIVLGGVLFWFLGTKGTDITSNIFFATVCPLIYFLVDCEFEIFREARLALFKLMPSDALSLQNIRQLHTRRPMRYVPFISGIVSLVLLYLVLTEFESWLRFIPSVFLLTFGLVSIRTAIFASDKEVKELTGELPMTTDTDKKFKDRI